MRPSLGVFALIFASVGLNAAAQLLLRLGMRTGLPVGRTGIGFLLDVALRPGVIGGLACYAISLVLWLLVLSRTEASFAYPFLGVGFVVVALASFLLLGESFTLRKAAGTLIIAAGVVVMAGK